MSSQAYILSSVVLPEATCLHSARPFRNILPIIIFVGYYLFLPTIATIMDLKGEWYVQPSKSWGNTLSRRQV